VVFGLASPECKIKIEPIYAFTAVGTRWNIKQPVCAFTGCILGNGIKKGQLSLPFFAI
jgi:hypothetical protein